MENTINVEGMKCEGCVNAVAKSLEKVSGISDVKVDLANGTATYKTESTDESTVKAAIESAGYKVK